jgi:hypothetical protein
MKAKKKRFDLPLEKLAEVALKEAVAEVIAEHKISGYSLAVWRDGRVVHLSPGQIEVRDQQKEYVAREGK